MKLHTFEKHWSFWHKLCMSSLPPPKNTKKIIDSISSDLSSSQSCTAHKLTPPTRIPQNPLCRLCCFTDTRAALPPSAPGCFLISQQMSGVLFLPSSNTGPRRDGRSEEPDSGQGDKGISCLAKPTNSTCVVMYVSVYWLKDVYTWQRTPVWAAL